MTISQAAREALNWVMKTDRSLMNPATLPMLDVQRHWLRIPRIRLFQAGVHPSKASPFTSPVHTPAEVTVFLNGKIVRVPSK